MSESKSRPLKISLSKTDLNGQYGHDVEFTADLSAVKDVITGTIGAIGPENCLKLGGGAVAATALYVLVRSIKKYWPWLKTTNVEMDVLEVSVPPKKEEIFTNLMEKNVLERRLVQDFENLDINLEGILGEETFDQCGEDVLRLLKNIRIKSIDQSIAASGVPENMAAGRIIKGRRNVKEYESRMAVFDKSEAKGIVTAEFIDKDAVVEGEMRGGMVAVGKGYDGNEATALAKGVYGTQIDGKTPGNDESPRAAPDEDCYRGGDQPQILIISNDEWGESSLPGYKKDVENLRKMWKDFNYKVTVYQNENHEDFLDRIGVFLQLLTGKEAFCAVFILSHGNHHKEHGDIVCCENGDIPVDNILGKFNNSNEKLQNTPKLFVFQFCRGLNRPMAVPISAKGAVAASPPDYENLPQMSDTLIMYATQPKDVAIVDDNGSWLIKALIHVFEEQRSKIKDREHVADMLTLVNRKVSGEIVRDSKDESLKGVKCMSEIRSTLRYKLYIKPHQ